MSDTITAPTPSTRQHRQGEDAPGVEMRKTGPGAWRIVHTGSDRHLPMVTWPTDDLPRYAAEIALAVLTHTEIDWTRTAGLLRADLDRVSTAVRDAAVIAHAAYRATTRK